jgi:hypothetical protein
MSWVAVAVVGGSVISAGAGYASSRSASGAAQRGADAATNEQARQYDQTRADYAPYRVTGEGALGQLARLYGLPSTTSSQWQNQQPQLVGDTELPAGTTTKAVGNGWYEVHYGGQRIGTLQPGGANGKFVNDTGADIPALMQQSQQQAQAANTPAGGPDMSVFTESPDYQFNLAQGQQAIDRSLASRGRSLSGAGVKEGVRYASGMASNEFGNFYNRLANLAGIGQTATGSTAAAGANAANNISQNHMFAGQARANGYMQAGQAANSAVQGGISNYMLSRYLQQPGAGTYGGAATPPYAGAPSGNWNGPR